MASSLNGAVRPRALKAEDRRRLRSRRAAIEKIDDQEMPPEERAAALEQIDRELEASDGEAPPLPLVPELIGVKASQVEEQPVEWVWRSRIPAGTLSLLTGKPNNGKTSIAVDLMARISAGLPLPGERSAGDPREVAIMSTEEFDRVLRLRFRAARADLDHVTFLRSTLSDGRGFDLRSGAEYLGRRIRAERLRLVVLDTISAMLPPGVDSHRDAAVREALRPLVLELDGTDCAVLGIRHLRKGATSDARDAGLGSVAFGAQARSEWLAGSHRGRRVLVSVKSNYCARPAGFFFETVGETVGDAEWSRVRWDEQTELSADELTGDADDPTSLRAEVAEALLEHLRDGPKHAGETIDYLCREFGVSKTTVHRAKRELGVETVGPERRGMKSPYIWKLPDSEGSSGLEKVGVSPSGSTG